MYFFLFLIAAQGVSLIVGYGRLLYLGFSVPALVGGFTVSAVTCRLAYVAAQVGGVTLEPWGSNHDWVYNSEVNAGLVNGFLTSRPFLCVGLILMSLLLAFLLAGVFTWVSVKPALGLAPVYMAILSFILPTLFAFVSLRIVWLGGNYMGVYIPDVFAFIDEGRRVYFLVFSGLVASIISVGMSWLRKRLDSLSGVRFDSSVLFFGGAFLGIAGCLRSFYFSFVVQANFTQAYWGWWPLLMLVLAGFDDGWRLVGGVFAVVMLRDLHIVFRGALQEVLYFPISYFENLLLGLLLILGLMIYQKRLSGYGGSA